MKIKIIFLSFFIAFFNILKINQAKASSLKVIDKVIYGDDNRLDVYQSSDSLMRELSRSTMALIPNRYMAKSGNRYNLMSSTLAERGICKSESFASQITAADCTGFLIADDILVTAGHCLENEFDCQNYSWVLDYSNISEEKSSFSFSADQVFHCAKIIAREKNQISNNDFLILKLDRPVLNRTPFKIRTAGKVRADALFTVIGHPSGLPVKITSSAKIRDNEDPIYFRLNADTYSGNSGSPVIDSQTGMVEGILVRGDTDYIQNENDSCLVSVFNQEQSGRGEDATRITNLISFLSDKNLQGGL